MIYKNDTIGTEVLRVPRFARVKPAGATFHIMCRSVSEVLLFPDDEDKNYYLDLLKRYCDKYTCSIYAYCLMDNHLHLHLDTKGFDLSKFMQSVNTAYVVYYNRKYNRHGHLFQGRFESKVVASDRYGMALSAYIHNNPKDIEGYNGKEEEYPFSSLGIYLGIRKDSRQLVDTGYILRMFDERDAKAAVKKYAEFVKKGVGYKSEKDIIRCIEQIELNDYRRERREIVREKKAEELIDAVARIFGVFSRECLHLKYKRNLTEFRSYMAFIMRSLCGYSYRQISDVIGGITSSYVSKLCSVGYELVKRRGELREHFEGLIGAAFA